MHRSAVLVAVLLGLLVVGLHASDAATAVPVMSAAGQPAAQPGSIEIAALPAKVDPRGGRFGLRLTNAGGEPVRELRVTVSPPPGVAVDHDPAPAELGAKASTVLVASVTGWPSTSPATILVRAAGQSSAGPVTALVAVELTAGPPVTMTIIGNNRITDRSRADLVAVVTNETGSPLEVNLHAEAGGHSVTFAKQMPVTVPARQTVPVPLTVHTQGTVRTGKLGIVVVATAYYDGVPPARASATRELDVALSSTDLVPGLLGIGTSVLLPGLVAVWLWLAVQRLDRRRLAAPTRSIAAQIWENKALLGVAVGASLLAAYVCAFLGIGDPLDAPTWRNLVTAMLVAAVLGAAGSAVLVGIHRARVPLIAAGSTPLQVLAAAVKYDPKAQRQLLKVGDDQQGVLVHRDRDKLVVAPQIHFSQPDTVVATLEEANDLRGAVARLGHFDGIFTGEGPWVRTPTVLDSSAASQLGTAHLLVYRSDLPSAGEQGEAFDPVGQRVENR